MNIVVANIIDTLLNISVFIFIGLLVWLYLSKSK